MAQDASIGTPNMQCLNLYIDWGNTLLMYVLQLKASNQEESPLPLMILL